MDMEVKRLDFYSALKEIWIKKIYGTVMAAPVISISSEVSVESMGSYFLRVILIGSISVEVPVAPEVGAVAVASPVGVLELDTHSSSEAKPSKSSPPPVSREAMVLPFLCSDDSKSDTEIPKRHVSPTTHDAMLTRWRSRVASRSSSPTTSIPEIPTAHILPAPSAIVAPSFEALTVRKSVRPLPSHRLALRYTSPYLDRFTSGSSSSYSSSDHSSFRHSILGHCLSRHTPPDTTDVDSSTPLRFGHSSLARTPRCSESYLCWRSPAATVNSPIHATRALVSFSVDLLLSRKRFRDFISLEDSVEEDIETDVLEVFAIEVDVGVDVEDKVEDKVESNDRGTIEVGVDVVARIDIPDAMLMTDVVERLEQVEKGL
ncbi:hypothetical protein Tco_0641938 [Tanacetum coccineum]